MNRFLTILTLAWCLAAPVWSVAAEEIIRPLADNRHPPEPLPLTPAELAWRQQHPVVTVAVKHGWMPIEFQLESAKHRGITVDYLQQISQLTGLHFKLVGYHDHMTATEVEMISSVPGMAVPAGFHRLARPLLSIPYAIYTHHDTSPLSGNQGLAALQRAKVAIFKHSQLGQQLHATYPLMQLVYVDIADEAFEYLANGQVDAYIGNEIVVDYHIEYHRLGFVKKYGVTAFSTEVSMATARHLPQLTTILDKAMRHLGANHAGIVQPWLAHPSPNASLAKTGMALLTILCLALLYQVWRLYQKARSREADAKRQIWQQANYDYLTQLPNRYLLQQRLEEAIIMASTQQQMLGVLLIDLDGFKDVNDIAGHATGDLLLRAAAGRIQGCVRSEDTTAKLGGDEFVVIITTLESTQRLHSISQQILEALRQPFQIEDKQFFITASIGVTLFPDNGDSAEALLMFADQAMYAAKRAGKNQYRFFTQTMQQSINDRLSLMRDLRSATLREELFLEYQPIFRLQDRQLVKAEALLRWRHPIRGIIAPDLFIPLAEESGYIIELGRWIFNRVLQDLASVPAAQLQHLHIGLNISPVQFSHPQHLLDFVHRLGQSPLPPAQVCFEITEGLLLEPTKTVESTLHSLKQAGIKLSIDDFGTGYSALAYLKKFQVDYVKIDRSFIQNLEIDNYDYILCRAIIQMAHELNMALIAEGVETVQQEALLTNIHCDYIQGFLYARPAAFSCLFDKRDAPH